MHSPLLIANRGEIACRIIRTARRLGLRTVAVYSDADQGALHTELADQAIRIGPAPARDSYLNIPAILDAARLSGAAAIHPGYGFLSENADFAEACAAAGLVFIGPPVSAMRAMADKAGAKTLMQAAGVPVVPGWHGDDQGQIVGAAQALGLPLLVKAAAGGGGKGMRVVRDARDLIDAMDGARREALAAFGDGRLILERYLDHPRHVEVQVLAHGRDVLILGDRDCSAQRRHQKVMEEAPAPNLSPELRARLHQWAAEAARAVAYVGAGTVEFLVQDDNAFFMEMNTRLQVEHAVTEALYGLDLVEWQLRIAAGEALPDLPEPHGHAMEARLYAEDPARDFLPSPGKLVHLRLPDGVRVDAGIRQGDHISTHYDPMIAKIIAHGADRAEAMARLDGALAATQVLGPSTNQNFLRAVLAHAAFAAGPVDVGFLDRERAALAETGPPPPQALAAAALVLHGEGAGDVSPDASPWGLRDGWRLNAPAQPMARVGEIMVPVPHGAGDAVAVRVGGTMQVWLDGHVWTIPLKASRTDATASGAGMVVAPMPGRVTKILVAMGDGVTRGQPLVVLEAMKMEHTLRAPADSVVQRVAAAEDDQVAEGAVLVVLVPHAN
ncbi:MAG: ATP-grasp domain-containing protein [Rhodospirillaceae bacterium]|nr:ATP-grasp domain-containing protein [Rhodospirillales bacterium]